MYVSFSENGNRENHKVSVRRWRKPELVNNLPLQPEIKPMLHLFINQVGRGQGEGVGWGGGGGVICTQLEVTQSSGEAVTEEIINTEGNQ